MLIAVVSVILSAITLLLGMGKIFMTRRECRLQHQAIDATDGQTAQRMQELIKIQKAQFQMLRSIVLYMQIPEDQKEKILNMPGARDAN